jgi:hypothetical protein
MSTTTAATPAAPVTRPRTARSDRPIDASCRCAARTGTVGRGHGCSSDVAFGGADQRRLVARKTVHTSAVAFRARKSFSPRYEPSGREGQIGDVGAYGLICHGGREGEGVGLWIGMMLPMSVSDGPRRMPAWPQMPALARQAERSAWTPPGSATTCCPSPHGQPVEGVAEGWTLLWALAAGTAATITRRNPLHRMRSPPRNAR